MEPFTSGEWAAGGPGTGALEPRGLWAVGTRGVGMQSFPPWVFCEGLGAGRWDWGRQLEAGSRGPAEPDAGRGGWREGQRRSLPGWGWGTLGAGAAGPDSPQGGQVGERQSLGCGRRRRGSGKVGRTVCPNTVVCVTASARANFGAALGAVPLSFSELRGDFS